jgi:hypothetical protein
MPARTATILLTLAGCSGTLNAGAQDGGTTTNGASASAAATSGSSGASTGRATGNTSGSGAGTSSSTSGSTSGNTCVAGSSCTDGEGGSGTCCNGLCTDTAVDSMNCGACGVVCPADQYCLGSCQAAPCYDAGTCCGSSVCGPAQACCSSGADVDYTILCVDLSQGICPPSCPSCA